MKLLLAYYQAATATSRTSETEVLVQLAVQTQGSCDAAIIATSTWAAGVKHRAPDQGLSATKTSESHTGEACPQRGSRRDRRFSPLLNQSSARCKRTTTMSSTSETEPLRYSSSTWGSTSPSVLHSSSCTQLLVHIAQPLGAWLDGRRPESNSEHRIRGSRRQPIPRQYKPRVRSTCRAADPGAEETAHGDVES